MRSRTVTLVMLTGAGAAAFGLAHIDPSQDEEDVLVYTDAAACTADKIRQDEECQSTYLTARAAYPEAAPRYDTMQACESHHGPGHCLTGGSVATSASGRFVPRMAGYVIGRRWDQDLMPQPIYEHAPDQRAESHGTGSHGTGYCTSWGGRVSTMSGGTSSRARVASSAVRAVSHGGFGGTGRSFSSHGSSSRGGFSRGSGG